MTGNQVFDFLFTLLPPLWVSGEIYERPARFVGQY